MSRTPEPLPDLSAPAGELPVPSELAQERDVVRRLEAALAAEHGADTPAYWRAMSDRLHAYLAGPKFANPRPRGAGAQQAHHWLTRVAAAYRALARPTNRP